MAKYKIVFNMSAAVVSNDPRQNSVEIEADSITAPDSEDGLVAVYSFYKNNGAVDDDGDEALDLEFEVPFSNVLYVQKVSE